jgi:hypothetical protein
LWNVSPTLFDALIQEGIVPPPLRIHGRVVWDMRSLKAAWRKFADSHSTDPDVNPWKDHWRKLSEKRTKSTWPRAEVPAE